MLQHATITSEDRRTALNASGGFLWWYADLRTIEGDGLVLVWSLGLPFLPGSRLAGPPRPALHLATYRKGRPYQYLLQEFSQDQVQFDLETGSATFDNTRLYLEERAGLVHLHAALDLALPGTSARWRGQIDIQGPKTTSPKTSVHSPHKWQPLSVRATGTAQLRSTTTLFDIEGSAYVDHNVSAEALTNQSIRRWHWGRLTNQRGTLIYYFLEGQENEELLVLAEHERELCPLNAQITFEGITPTLFGAAPRRLRLETELGLFTITLKSLVDNGPFYKRFLSEATGPTGEISYGVSELVLPLRIDIPWQRTFIRMKTHRPGSSNSFWLPLFVGAEGSPTRRLLQSIGTRHD